MKFYCYCTLLVFLLLTGCKDGPTNNTNTKPDPDLNPPEEEPAELACTDGISAAEYSCANINLVAHVSPDDLMGQPLSEENPLILNDIWGWTDPQTGTEYALVGLNDGVTFVDISTPSEPVVVGKLPEELNDGATSTSKSGPSAGFNMQHHEKSSWRDFKVYQNYLYVVSDAQPQGLQIFDLTKLRDVSDPPEMFAQDAHYDQFDNAHNIAINEETGFGYIVGSNTYGGGLHIIDLQIPLSPQFAGFHQDTTVGRDSTGYVHDTQCVVYEGPDTDYQGDEICMNSSETHLVIANVTDKQKTKTISKATYESNSYAHQGWLTEDQKYFLLDDELDEWHYGSNTRTYIWDVQDLDNPKLINTYTSEFRSIDHNQYVKGNYVYQSNYTTGLRILSLENIANGQLEEVAYFDTFPSNDAPQFDGSWSNYPYFESGIIIVGDISNGLFILQPNLD